MVSCAVLTDVASSGYFLEPWLAYYGAEVGQENLYVLTFDERLDDIRSRVGRLINLDRPYDEELRLFLINDITAKLLARYDAVIHADVDEFIIPDPSNYAGLIDYLERIDVPYVTAIGLDVIELASDSELNYTPMSLLKQRGAAIKSVAYSKTCVIRQPVTWNYGFHTANVRPAFGDLFLFHMKFADVARRLRWLSLLTEKTRGNASLAEHFETSIHKLARTIHAFRAMPFASGADPLRDPAFRLKMERGIEPPRPGESHYRMIQGTDDVLCRIPQEFAGKF